MKSILSKTISAGKLTCIASLLGLLISCDNGGGLTGGNKKEERRITQKRDDSNATPVGPSTRKPPIESSKAQGETGEDIEAKPSPGGNVPAPITNQETQKDSETAQAQTDFKGWCAKASEVEPVTSGRLKPLLAEFCDGGNPTQLLTKNLIGAAFVGAGEPTFTDLKPLASANNTTSYRFAIAIKIPISIKDHLDKVGPKAGDVNEIKRLQESVGNGTTAVVTLLQSHPAAGKYHVQGFTTNSKVTTPVLITTVVTEADTRNDRFNLVDGEQVMYTQYTSRAVQTLKYFDYIAAGVKVGNSAYLIVVVDAALDNKGFTSVAEERVRSLAVIGIKQMYSLAASAK